MAPEQYSVTSFNNLKGFYFYLEINLSDFVWITFSSHDSNTLNPDLSISLTCCFWYRVLFFLQFGHCCYHCDICTGKLSLQLQADTWYPDILIQLNISVKLGSQCWIFRATFSTPTTICFGERWVVRSNY